MSPNPIVAEKTGDHPSAKAAGNLITDLKKILVPMDFSPESYKALKYAIRMAEQFFSEITLLHVVENPNYTDEVYNIINLQQVYETLKAELESKLKEAQQESKTELLHFATPQVRIGRTYDQIAETARELNIDLIIMGTHGYKGIKHMALGSTAEKAIRFAPCPVLVVRQKEREFVK